MRIRKPWIVWSVSYLIKTMQIEIELIRKRFGIYGFFNIFSLIGVLLVIFVGSKYLLFYRIDYFNLGLLVSLILLLAGLTMVNPDSKKYLRKIGIMNAYFPSIEIGKVKKYYKYRKSILACLLIFYCLFPLDFEVENIKCFFAMSTFLLLCMLINTICSTFLSKTLAESVHTFIRIVYSVILALYARNMISLDIDKLILNSDVTILSLSSSILLILNFFILSMKSKKRYKYV